MKKQFLAIAFILSLALASFGASSNDDSLIVNTVNLNVHGVANFVSNGWVNILLTITNAPIALTNQTLLVNGYTFSWTSTPANAYSQIQITNTTAQAATNLFGVLIKSGLTNSPLKNLIITLATNSINFRGIDDCYLLVSNTAPWAAITVTTNAPIVTAFGAGGTSVGNPTTWNANQSPIGVYSNANLHGLGPITVTGTASNGNTIADYGINFDNTVAGYDTGSSVSNVFETQTQALTLSNTLATADTGISNLAVSALTLAGNAIPLANGGIGVSILIPGTTNKARSFGTATSTKISVTANTPSNINVDAAAGVMVDGDSGRTLDAANLTGQTFFKPGAAGLAQTVSNQSDGSAAIWSLNSGTLTLSNANLTATLSPAGITASGVVTNSSLAVIRRDAAGLTNCSYTSLSNAYLATLPFDSLRINSAAETLDFWQLGTVLRLSNAVVIAGRGILSTVITEVHTNGGGGLNMGVSNQLYDLSFVATNMSGTFANTAYPSATVSALQGNRDSRLDRVGIIATWPSNQPSGAIAFSHSGATMTNYFGSGFITCDGTAFAHTDPTGHFVVDGPFVVNLLGSAPRLVGTQSNGTGDRFNDMIVNITATTDVPVIVIQLNGAINAGASTSLYTHCVFNYTNTANSATLPIWISATAGSGYTNAITFVDCSFNPPLSAATISNASKMHIYFSPPEVASINFTNGGSVVMSGSAQVDLSVLATNGSAGFPTVPLTVTNYIETTGQTFTNGAIRAFIRASITLTNSLGATAYAAVSNITANIGDPWILLPGAAAAETHTLTIRVGPNDVCVVSNSADANASSVLNWVKGTQ